MPVPGSLTALAHFLACLPVENEQLNLTILVRHLKALEVRLGVQKLDLCAWERGYMLGFGPIEAFNSFVHPTLVAPRLPFLPLLATSTYCAVGAIYSGWLMFKLWREYHDESASKALDSGP